MAQLTDKKSVADSVIPEAGRAGNDHPALFDDVVIVKNERAL
jgi:hypothetical protein